MTLPLLTLFALTLALSVALLAVFAAGGALEAAHRRLLAVAHLAAAEAVAHLPERAFEAAQRLGGRAAPRHLAQLVAALLRLGPAIRIAVAASGRRVAQVALQAFEMTLVAMPRLAGRAV